MGETWTHIFFLNSYQFLLFIFNLCLSIDGHFTTNQSFLHIMVSSQSRSLECSVTSSLNHIKCNVFISRYLFTHLCRRLCLDTIQPALYASSSNKPQINKQIKIRICCVLSPFNKVFFRHTKLIFASKHKLNPKGCTTNLLNNLLT